MGPNQRERLLEAMLLELGEKGYRGISVSAALVGTGVSEAEFEAEFADIDECLFTAYERASEGLVDKATEGCESDAAWPSRVRTGLARLLGEIAARPEMAEAMTRAFPGIRPAAYERYVDLLSSFVPFMREGREYSEVDEELPVEVELLAVGAAEAIIFGEVDAGRAQRLPAMMPEILFSVLVPFIGPDRATEEMRSATAAH
jgi:AcrR family transcriptional regulator